MRTRFWLRVVLLVVLPFCASTRTFSQVPFKLFDQEAGLSDNHVTSIIQDKVGYLWIGTLNGLNRFDGRSFTVYKYSQANDNTIAQNSITTLAVDSKNRIWIGHSGKGVSCYDPSENKFERYNLLGDTTFQNVSFIHTDHNDHIWIGLGTKGVLILNPVSNEIRRIDLSSFVNKKYNRADQLALNTVYDMLEADGDTVWLATHDGLYRYLRNADSLFPVRLLEDIPGKHRDDLLMAMLEDGQGGFWFGSWTGGVSHYDPKEKHFKTFKYTQDPFGNIVFDVARRDQNSLWVSGEKGIGIFKTESGTFSFVGNYNTTYRSPDIGNSSKDFSDEVFMTTGKLFQDNQGNTWAASNLGLFMIASTNNSCKFSSIYEPSSIFSIRDIVFDSTLKKKFFATEWGPGLLISDMDDRHWRNFEPLKNPSFENFNLVKDILDEGDSLWVVSRDNVRIFDKVDERWAGEPLLESLRSKTTSSYFKMIKATNGDYWIASYRHGAYRINHNDKRIENFTFQQGVPNSISSNSLTDVLEDKYGRIWFATLKGPNVYDPKLGAFLDFTDEEKLTKRLRSTLVNSMAVDKKGDVWIASQDLGIIRASITNRDKIQFTAFDNELLSTPASFIAIDEKDRVWYTGVFGINVFDQYTGIIRTFDAGSGLAASQVVEDLPVIKLGEKMIIGSSHGFYTIDEEYLRPDSSFRPLVISSVKVYGEEVADPRAYQNGGHLELDYDYNSITIDFASIDFSNASQIKYSYKLEVGGVDEDWSPPTKSRSVTFAHLQGGQYVFQLRSTNRDGLWNPNPILLSFTVDKPFWQTSWFYSIATLFVAFVAFSYVYIRTRNIKARERYNTEMNKKVAEMELSALRAQINPHFLFNSLSSINRFIIKSEPIKASEYLVSFSKLIRMILEASREQFIPLSEELTMLDLYLELESLRVSRPFTYKIQVNQDIDKINTRLPSMVTQPYIENAIWHGLLMKETSGSLLIDISKEDKYLKIIIEDDGIGRGAHKNTSRPWKKKSYGMQITQERLQTLNFLMNQNSHVVIEDLADHAGKALGTRVILMLEYTSI